MLARRFTLLVLVLVFLGVNAAGAAAAFVPDDPGPAGVPGGWQEAQWNLTSPYGINVLPAWEHLIAAGRPGGRDVVVAVLDTGVAYRDRGRFKATPDISTRRFVRGYDFVDGDAYPNDVNGHGTHVASTIAETTNNALGVTGIAYGARIMPVRVLDRRGEGRVSRVVEGIDWAVEHGAQIINLSVEFDPATRLADIPDVVAAVARARKAGVLVVAAAGNSRRLAPAYPARAPGVVAVGATTEHGCQAEYANTGAGLDLVAPGGGRDAVRPREATCQPTLPAGRNIVQMTYAGNVRTFGLPADYEGTSMAAAHVTAVAALVIASGVLGPQPTPARIERRLRATARDLGPAGYDRAYGWGLVDAGRATDPAVP